MLAAGWVSIKNAPVKTETRKENILTVENIDGKFMDLVIFRISRRSNCRGNLGFKRWLHRNSKIFKKM
jgi:hypothetical protein